MHTSYLTGPRDQITGKSIRGMFVVMILKLGDSFILTEGSNDKFA